jgi:hypothetical protein
MTLRRHLGVVSIDRFEFVNEANLPMVGLSQTKSTSRGLFHFVFLTSFQPMKRIGSTTCMV